MTTLKWLATVAVVAVIGACQASGLQAQRIQYVEPTRAQQLELQTYVEAYLSCGRLVAEEIAVQEPNLEAEGVVPVAAARCKPHRELLDGKVLELEGPDIGPQMSSFDTTNFRITVVAATNRKRREMGI